MNLKRPSLKLAAPLVVIGVAIAGGTAYAVTSDSPDTSAFMAPDFTLPALPAGGQLSQSIAGLWAGDPATSYSEVSGPSWVSVSSTGLITGTEPASAGATPAVVTVSATDGSVTGQIEVIVPARASGQPATLEAASWNLDDAGQNAAWSGEQKEVRAIIAGNLQVVGVQESNGVVAAALAKDLGWYSYQEPASDPDGGDLGIISAYPISNVADEDAGATPEPAVAATVDVDGQNVRIWSVHLSDANYGPETACFTSPAPSAATLVSDETASTRYAQAEGIAADMKGDISAASTTPVIMLGDLESPSSADWTAATASSHCTIGAVNWPVPNVFANAGLTDSYRVAYPNPATDPGNTWSPTTTTNANGDAEPQDRIDYVDYAGSLSVLGAESYATGWKSPSTGADVTTWPSNHAAAVTLFQLPASSTPAAITGNSTTGGDTSDGEPADSGEQQSVSAAGTDSASSSASSGSPVPGSGSSSALAAQPAGGAPAAAGTAPAQMASALTARAGTVAVTGTARVGDRLAAHTRAWVSGTTFSYRWYAGASAITHATGKDLKLTAAQAGTKVSVHVTAATSLSRIAVASRPVAVKADRTQRSVSRHRAHRNGR